MLELVNFFTMYPNFFWWGGGGGGERGQGG